MLKYMSLIFIYCGVLVLNTSLADNHALTYNSATGISLPPPPPPDDGSCTKGGPGKVSKNKCNNFELMLNRYLKDEGSNNRGLRFYEAILLYDSINRNKNNDYFFNLSKVIEKFGDPDFKRVTKQLGKQVNQFTYLFNYQSNKDWFCVITVYDNRVKSIGYGETKAMIFGGWRKYN